VAENSKWTKLTQPMLISTRHGKVGCGSCGLFFMVDVGMFLPICHGRPMEFINTPIKDWEQIVWGCHANIKT
jgi:hypothetical protein